LKWQNKVKEELMAKGKKLSKAAQWAKYLKAFGARNWRELTPKERAAAYERCLRHLRNLEGALPDAWHAS
jgi:hypothetical protein